MEEFLKEKELSRLLNITVAALRRWRLIGRGPQFTKLGSAVRYRKSEIEAWLAIQPRGGESACAESGIDRRAA